MTDEDLIERIKRNLPSLESMARPKHAQKAGYELQGCHPLHGATGTGKSDKESNNFSVNTKKQVWHCWAHNSGGGPLAWIAVQEGLVSCQDAGNISDIFPEVLKIAAERAGIDLDISEEDKEKYKKIKREREELYEAFEAAQKYFKDNLNDDVIRFIQTKYGFDREMVEKYGIGFAPPRERGLLKYLEKEVGENAYKTGLVLQAAGKFIDFFQGRVTFPYYKNGKIVYFIARHTEWTPDDAWQQAKYLKQQVGARKKYVSDEVQNHLYGLDSIRGEDEVFVTEGVTDAISLLQMGYPCVSPVTVRFKKEDIKKVQRAVKNKKVYVCNDADDAGLKGAVDTIEEINDSALIELDEGDLNDHFKEHPPADFAKLVKNALPREDALAKYKDDMEYLFIAALEEQQVNPYRVRRVWDKEAKENNFFGIFDILDHVDSLKKAIAIFRRTDKYDFRTPNLVEASLRDRIISGVIMRDMQKKGKFLYDVDADRVYYFSRKEHEVFPLNSHHARHYFQYKYGVNMEEKEGRMARERLITYGAINGEEVKVQKYFWYDKAENKLYIHNRNDHCYVLDGETVELIPNGEEVYFETTHGDKIVYLEHDAREYPDEVPGQMSDWKDEGNVLHHVLVNRTNFASKTALQAEQQRLQFLITLYMFPFGSRFYAKPIMAYIGQKGSGKSVTMRMLGRFLTNTNYELASMPDTEKKDFMVAAHNNPLYFLDNVEKRESWLNDALAAIATGVSLKSRKLYSDFDQAEAKINSFVGINARDPKFKRDDVVDRLLIFYVDRLESNMDPNFLYSYIEDYWNTLWSVFIDDLNKIVKKYGEVDTSKIRSKHRLVEWVVFARIVQRALDIPAEEVDNLIRDMKYEKDAFSLEDDALLNALYQLMDGDEVHDGQWMGATDLHDLLCETSDLYAGSYKSSQSLAKRLPHVQSELSDLIGLKQRHNRSKHRNEYCIGKGESGLDKFSAQDEDVTSTTQLEIEDDTSVHEVFIDFITDAEAGAGRIEQFKNIYMNDYGAIKDKSVTDLAAEIAEDDLKKIMEDLD